MPSLPDRPAGRSGGSVAPRSGAGTGRGIILMFLLLALTLSGEPALAASSPKGKKEGSAPVSMVVRADHMLARNIENEITFSGHVHLVKGTLRLHSDDLVVFLKKAGKGKTLMEQSKGGSSSQRVETMVATGHVVIHTPHRVAYAGKAVYVQAAHLFVLTEEPVVIQNGDRMSGERITFFTRLNKSVIQGHSLMLLSPRKKSSPSKKGAGMGQARGADVH